MNAETGEPLLRIEEVRDRAELAAVAHREAEKRLAAAEEELARLRRELESRK